MYSCFFFSALNSQRKKNDSRGRNDNSSEETTMQKLLLASSFFFFHIQRTEEIMINRLLSNFVEVKQSSRQPVSQGFGGGSGRTKPIKKFYSACIEIQ